MSRGMAATSRVKRSAHARNLSQFKVTKPGDSPAAGLVIQWNRWLRRKREEHDFVDIETVPEPEVSSANPSNPCPPGRPLSRLEIRGAR
jgi:hypothetical protein